eukprot:scaffold301096_cov30-Tisochrysis_lutea.AAC.1
MPHLGELCVRGRAVEATPTRITCCEKNVSGRDPASLLVLSELGRVAVALERWVIYTTKEGGQCLPSAAGSRKGCSCSCCLFAVFRRHCRGFSSPRIGELLVGRVEPGHIDAAAMARPPRCVCSPSRTFSGKIALILRLVSGSLARSVVPAAHAPLADVWVELFRKSKSARLSWMRADEGRWAHGVLPARSPAVEWRGAAIGEWTPASLRLSLLSPLALL